MEIIKIDNLSFSYNDKNIFKNINLTVNKGDFICIVGENGCGKTTLFKLLLGLEKAYSGAIELKSNKISYINQKATSFNQDFPATVYEIVKLGAYNKGFRNLFLGKQAKNKINSILETVGLSSQKNKKIGRLSGGQQQRTFIAKAVLNDPEIIFLDEPTAGVDQNNVEIIVEVLDKLNKENNITMLVVTHDYEIFEKYANKLIIIKKGGDMEIREVEK